MEQVTVYMNDGLGCSVMPMYDSEFIEHEWIDMLIDADDELFYNC